MRQRYRISLILGGMPIGREPFVDSFDSEAEAREWIAGFLASQGKVVESITFDGLNVTVSARPA